MKKNMILKILGLFYLIIGSTLQMNMMMDEAWPTYFFIIICLIGVLLLLVAFFVRKIPWLIQFIIGFLLTSIVVYLLF